MPGKGPPATPGQDPQLDSVCGTAGAGAQSEETGPGTEEAGPGSEEAGPALGADEVRSRLVAVLEAQQTMEAWRREDIAVRVEVLHSAVSSGVLERPILDRLGQLLTALESGALETADRLQRALVVDYPSECTTWVVGVRQLMGHLRGLHSDGHLGSGQPPPAGDS